MKINIFQGNEILSEAIINTLFPEKNVNNEQERYPFCTKDIYFTSFFYLTKKYGEGQVVDEYKDAAEWEFTRKEFEIIILIDSSFVNFMIFGDAKHYSNHSHMTPYRKKWYRENARKKDLLLPDYFEEGDLLTKKQSQIFDELWSDFVHENSIEGMDRETYLSGELPQKWYEKISAFNDSVLGINIDSYAEKYGYTYKNRHTKRALKVMRQFLNELMEPISVRDVSFNLKGRI